MLEYLGDEVLFYKEFINFPTLEALKADFESRDLKCADLSSVPQAVKAYFSNGGFPKIARVSKNTTIDNILYKSISGLVSELTRIYPGINIVGDEGYRYNLYEVGMSYNLHVDRSNMNDNYRSRYVSIVIGLNSDYTGGELHFPRQGLEVRLESGDAVIFPAGYTHPHQVLPVKSGSRKNVVTWLY